MSEILGSVTGIKDTDSAVYSMVKCLKEYSQETYEHSVAVSELAGRLGAVLGYSTKDVMRLNLAGMLHDIGKLTIPLSVLHKKGALDEAEWELMKKHPEAGYKMLLPHMDDVAVLLAIRQHHEHMDGSGYPDGLSGGITEFAKIITLADVFDGLTRKRSYRRNEISMESAKKIMLMEQNRYDRKYLEIFLEVVIQNTWEGAKAYV